MPCETWLQTSRNAAMDTTGAPRSSHSCRMCARGSSPRQIATMGFRNPRPISDSTRIAASIAALTRGKCAFGEVAEAGFAAGGGAATSAGPSATLALLADDIAALDL